MGWGWLPTMANSCGAMESIEGTHFYPHTPRMKGDPSYAENGSDIVKENKSRQETPNNGGDDDDDDTQMRAHGGADISEHMKEHTNEST